MPPQSGVDTPKARVRCAATRCVDSSTGNFSVTNIQETTDAVSSTRRMIVSPTQGVEV